MIAHPSTRNQQRDAACDASAAFREGKYLRSVMRAVIRPRKVANPSDHHPTQGGHMAVKKKVAKKPAKKGAKKPAKKGKKK